MKYKILFGLALVILFVYIASAPIREISRIPDHHTSSEVRYPLVKFDSLKKTVLIIADNKGTEIFDLIAPYYLFSMTGKANLFIVSKEKNPIAVMKGFFTLPHYTFAQIDSLGIIPSVIVIPNFSGTEREKQDPYIISWITKTVKTHTKVLSICAGSVTAASTGLFDGNEMTTHASEINENKKQFKNPLWIENVTYTKSGNFYSTAGVSNAVEGSLAVIEEEFGKEIMLRVLNSIYYPYSNIRKDHKSIPIGWKDKAAIVKKVFFHNDPKIGVFIQDGIDEFALSAVLDSYNRSFPSSIKTYSIQQSPTTTKFGLVILPTGNTSEINNLDELHVISDFDLSEHVNEVLKDVDLIKYDLVKGDYIFDVCLQRISSKYGTNMETVVKRLLDYN